MPSDVEILDSRIVDDNRVESRIMAGKSLLIVKSSFDGSKPYKELLESIIERKLKNLYK